MAIWSLTQERVEKLRKQIGDKEEEIDTLIKLSPKDIWNVDLDAFVEEWNTQLDEEAKRKKKIAGITRRASKKLGIDGGKGKKKKRKMGDSDSDDDSGSDFGPVKKKAKPKTTGGLLSYLRQDSEPVKKPSATDALKSSSAFGTAAPKQGTLLSHLVKKESTPQLDGASDDNAAAPEPARVPAPVAGVKRGRKPGTKVVKKAPVIDIDDDDSDVFAAVAKDLEKKKPAETVTAPRAGRPAATKKAPTYNFGDDLDSDSDGDDLGDISMMVKTIGAGSKNVPLLKATSTARPRSNGSARAAAATGAAKVSKKNSPIDSDDDTNYEGLMPTPSPRKPAPRTVNDTIMSSDSDNSELQVSKPVPTKAAPKPKAAVSKLVPKPKVPSAVPAPKATVLSPAAKAYAAKLAKASGGPAKPAPKAKKPAKVVSDDEIEDDTIMNELLSDDDEPTPKPAARAPAARPGRRAAAAPAKYVVSDDDEDEDDASEPSFDDDDSE